ncbi:GNAT family N-acetyltransferase [Orbaceae bacterium ESL0721]|nr:GNAT family N-acetyltransferase [Orbaceae bacterium ESL0721]
MIKQATLFDVPDIVRIGHDLYNESANHNQLYKWDDESALSTCKFFVTNESSLVLIDKGEQGLKGFFIGQILTPLASKDKMALDVMFFIRPAYRGGTTAYRLIKRYEEWARSHDVKYIQLGSSSGLSQQRTLNMYSRLGYVPQAVTYVKEV